MPTNMAYRLSQTPGKDVMRTPTCRDLSTVDTGPCWKTDYANARSKFINFARVKVLQNAAKLRKEWEEKKSLEGQS